MGNRLGAVPTPGERGGREGHAIVGADDPRQAVLLEEPKEDRPGQRDRGRQQALAHEQAPAVPIDDGQRIAVDAVAGLELAFEVRGPGPVGRGHRDERPARVCGHRAAPRCGDESRAIQQIADGAPSRKRPRGLLCGHPLQQLRGAPRRMALAHLQQGRDDRRWRLLGRMRRPTRPIDEARGAARVIPVDPFIGGLPTDAVAPRQRREVEHVALDVRNELHALIHE